MEIYKGRTAIETKSRAVERHIAQDEVKQTLARELAGHLVSYPDLIKDAGIRHTGFESAITTYKRLLYKQGVCPTDIESGVIAVQDKISKRNGKAEFISNMQIAAHRFLGVENAIPNQHPVQMMPNEELQLVAD